MINKKIILILGILLNCATALPALSGCSITVTPVNFGNYNVSATSGKTSTGSVTYNCTSATAITIDLSAGNATSYTSYRQLKDGSHSLEYNLYLDAGGTQIWGNGIGGITDHYINSSATTGTETIFGIIRPLQSGAYVGNYTDPITATINF
jgi:spore coat protein U-like protein